VEKVIESHENFLSEENQELSICFLIIIYINIISIIYIETLKLISNAQEKILLKMQNYLRSFQAGAT
jgi:hypothetical protein